MIYVRIAKPSEFDQAKEFMQSLFPDAYIDMAEDDLLLLAEVEGKTVGFAHLSDEGERLIFRGLGVSDAMRGRGIGTTLMERMVEMLQDAYRPIYLKVKMLNPAIDLYSRFGFTLKKFGDPHIMVKRPNN